MPRLRWLVFVLLVAISLSPSARGDVVYSNGSPDHYLLADVTTAVTAEDFILSSPAIATGGYLWAYDTFFATDWDGTIEYHFFNDAGGVPATVPFASGDALNVVKSPTFFSIGPFSEYVYSFNLAAPVLLAAGTPYWLGLHLSQDFDDDNIDWGSGYPGYGSTALGSANATFDNWQDTGTHLAFAITGVPEPSGLVLAALGSLAIGVARRRK